MKFTLRKALSALILLSLFLPGTASYGWNSEKNSKRTETNHRQQERNYRKSSRHKRDRKKPRKRKDPPCRRGKNSSPSKPCNGQARKENPSDCDCGTGKDDKPHRSRRTHRI